MTGVAVGEPSGEAAYKRLAGDLRQAILRRRYAGGVRLPTEAELADRYRVSRQTVRRAFHDLVADGMVYRVPGRGTFAAASADRYLRQFGSIEDLMALSLDTRMEVLAPLRRRVCVEAAGQLRVDGDVVHAMTLRRSHHGVPFCHTAIHLSPAAADVLADVPELRRRGATTDATVIGLLDTRLSAPIAEAQQSITAVSADEPVTDALGCQPGRPLLRVDRTYRTTRGDTVELAVSHFLPQQYSYRVKLRRSAG